jgi:hypothetical protein
MKNIVIFLLATFMLTMCSSGDTTKNKLMARLCSDNTVGAKMHQMGHNIKFGWHSLQVQSYFTSLHNNSLSNDLTSIDFNHPIMGNDEYLSVIIARNSGMHFDGHDTYFYYNEDPIYCPVQSWYSTYDFGEESGASFLINKNEIFVECFRGFFNNDEGTDVLLDNRNYVFSTGQLYELDYAKTNIDGDKMFYFAINNLYNHDIDIYDFDFEFDTDDDNEIILQLPQFDINTNYLKYRNGSWCWFDTGKRIDRNQFKISKHTACMMFYRKVNATVTVKLNK